MPVVWVRDISIPAFNGVKIRCAVTSNCQIVMSVIQIERFPRACKIESAYMHTY
jgi:hypothetical protein